MGYARYIGRVGALAVALGVGAAVATTPGVAWAEDGTTADAPADPGPAPAESPSTPDPAPSTNNDPPGGEQPPSGVGEAPSGQGSPSQTTTQLDDGVTISSSGGAIDTDDTEEPEDEAEETSTPTTEAATPSPTATPPPTSPPTAPQSSGYPGAKGSTAPTTSRTSAATTTTSTTVATFGTVDAAPAGLTSMRTMGNSADAVVSTLSAGANAVAPQSFSTTTTTAPASTPVSVITGVLAAVFAPFASTGPAGVPVESPALWALLAAARRQIGSLLGSDHSAGQQQLSSLTTEDASLRTLSVAAAATAIDGPPVFNAPVVGTPNVETGVVTGTVKAVDPNGKAVTYSVTGQPPGGTVTVNATTGAFTYTPTGGTRLAAGFTPAVDTDNFVVTANDGTKKSTQTVAVTVAPTFVTPGTAPVGVGNNPSSVALTTDGSRAYVANQGSGTVSVINTATGAVSTINVGGTPTAVAVNKAGTRAYVTNTADNTVSVINTSTNTVLTKVAVGAGPTAVAVSPDDSRVYVVNAGAGTVTKINTTTNKVVGYNNVGTNPSSITFSADGTRVFVTNTGSDSITQIAPATNQVKTIAVGDAPIASAVSADLSRVYVVHADGSVKAVDGQFKTNVTNVATTGTPAAGVALTSDGRTLLVVNRNDTVTAINTATNTVVGTFSTDTAPEAGNQRIVLSPNGKTIYVLDAADRLLRNFNITHNLPPVATNDAVTVAEGATQTITVLGNDTDTVGAPINPGSVLVTQPANGNAVVNANGTVTYISNGNEVTSDSFTYTVKDTLGATSNTATVNITITPVNDPTAVGDDTATVNEDSGANPINVLANDSDSDGPLTITAVTQPANGTVAITGGGTGLTYTPNANFNGNNTFTYTVTQGGVETTATVTVTVTAQPDATTVTDDTATVNEDSGATAINVLANDNDPDGPLTITAVTQPSGGTVAITGGGTGLTYTPNANFNGNNTFTYTVTQGGVNTTANVTVTVNAVADPTVAVNDSATVNEDSGANTIDVLGNDSDPDGPLTITAVTQPTSGGAVAIVNDGTAVSFTPTANFNGTRTFNYTVTQGGVNTTRTVTVTVTPVNDPPVATSAPTFGAPNVNGVVTGSLNVSDADNDALTYTVTQPASGTVTVSGGTFTYTPKGEAQLAAYASEGDDVESFTVTVTDGKSTPITVTVSDVVIRPSIAVLDEKLNYSGSLGSTAVKGPDSKYYMTVSGGTAGVRVVVIDPADPNNPTIVDAEGQNAHGGVVWGTDGKAYQSAYTTTNGVDHSYVTVIDPNNYANPVVIDAGAGRPSTALQNGPDGNIYLTTTSTNTNTLRVVQIDPTDPTNPTIAEAGPGNPYSSIQFASDGNMYLTTYTSTGSSSGGTYSNYTTRVVRIDPANFTQPTVITAGTGFPYRTEVHANGTVFQTSYTYDYVNNNYVYTPRIAVITPQNPNEALVATLPSGVDYYNVDPLDVSIGSEGHVFLRSYNYNYNNGAPVYSNWVTVWDPQNPQAPTTVTLPGDSYSSNIAFGPDGTAYATSYDYNNGYVNYVTVIDPDSPAQAVDVTLPGTNWSSNTLLFAPDGTAYASTYNSTGSGASTTYTNYMTVIDPQDPANPTIHDLSAVSTSFVSVVGAANSGVWLRSTNATGQNIAFFFDPTNPANATTVTIPGTGANSQAVASDGTLYTVHYTTNSSGQTVNWGVTVLDADAPTNPTTINLASSPGSAIVTGAGGVAYLTAGQTTVSGQTTTQVLVFKPSDPTHPVTVPITGAYNQGVFVAQDGSAVQIVRNSAGNAVTLAIISPDDPMNPVKLTYAGSQYTSTTGPDGKYYMTLSGGSGIRVLVLDLADPTNPTVVNAGAQVGALNPSGAVVFGADGKGYQVSYSTVGSVNHTYVTVIDPANLANPTVIDAGDGRAATGLQRGPDGNFYLVNTATTDGSVRVVRISPANPTNPTIINAGPGTGINSSIQFASDGKYYLTTFTGTGSANGFSDYTTRVVRIDPNNFTQPTVITAGTGTPRSVVDVFSDGTIMQLSYSRATVNGVTTYTPYLAVVTPQNPNQALVVQLPTNTQNGNDAVRVTYAPDGTIYAQTYNRLTSNTYTYYVTVVDPQSPAQATTITLPNTYTGSSSTDVLFGPDGTAYVQSYNYNNGYTNYLTVIDPQDPSQAATVTLPGTQYSFGANQRQFGPDGTAYFLSQSYNGTGYTRYLTVVDPQNPTQATTITLPGNQYISSNTFAVGSDGTAYLVASDYNNATGNYLNYVTIIDPQNPSNPVITNLTGLTQSSVSIIAAGDDQVLLNAIVSNNAAIVLVHLDNPSNPTVISSVGYPYGDTVTGADGILYRTSYSYENGYTTRVLVVHPSDPTRASVITIPGYPAGTVIIGADGKVVQPVHDYNNTVSLAIIQTADVNPISP